MWSESLLRIVNNLMPILGSSYSMILSSGIPFSDCEKPVDFAGAKFIHAKMGGNSSWHFPLLSKHFRALTTRITRKTSQFCLSIQNWMVVDSKVQKELDSNCYIKIIQNWYSPCWFENLGHFASEILKKNNWYIKLIRESNLYSCISGTFWFGSTTHSFPFPFLGHGFPILWSFFHQGTRVIRRIRTTSRGCCLVEKPDGWYDLDWLKL